MRQLREPRERQHVPAGPLRLGQAAGFVAQMREAVLEVERHRIIDRAADALGLQVRLQLVAALDPDGGLVVDVLGRRVQRRDPDARYVSAALPGRGRRARGTAPEVAKKGNGVVTTASPGCRSSAWSGRSSASVPLAHAMPCFAWASPAMALSSRGTLGPMTNCWDCHRPP